MNSIDTDRDGVIDKGEWVPVEKRARAAVERMDDKYHSISNPADVITGFDSYDVDHDGMIAFDELNKGLCQR
jgi:Ca2+-binding EF-hand superfamily protein